MQNGFKSQALATKLLKPSALSLQDIRRTQSLIVFNNKIIHIKILKSNNKICKIELQKKLIPLHCYFVLGKLWEIRKISKNQYNATLKKLHHFCEHVSELKMAHGLESLNPKLQKKVMVPCLKKISKALQIKKYKKAEQSQLLFKFLE